MTKRTRKRLLWILIVLFIIIGPPLLLYAGGWRLTPDFSLKRVGGIFISADTSGAEIYLDKKLMKRTNMLQRGLFVQGLTPDTVSVIVAKEGYWPWTKNLLVKENVVTEARAFLLPREVSGKSILRGTYNEMYRVPEYPYLMLEKNRNNGFFYEFYSPTEQQFVSVRSGNTFLSSSEKFKTFFVENGIFYLVFPSRTVEVRFDANADSLTALSVPRAPQISSLPSLPHLIITDNRSQSRIWILEEGNAVFAEWLSPSPLPYYFEEHVSKIFESQERIKSIDFYHSRRDAALLAVKNSVFVLELDGRSIRNFQPLYKGNNPYVARINAFVYILDGGNLLQVQF